MVSNVTGQLQTRVAWWLPFYLDLVHGLALMFCVVQQS